MRKVGHIATYPARIETLPAAIDSVAKQLDELFVVLNQYDSDQAASLPRFPNVTYHLPDIDLKDTGKFLFERGADDYVFLADDDITYPQDYVSKLIEFYERLPSRRFVVGLHGVIYSDMFEGGSHSRFVAKFDKALTQTILVNQLGTGCAMTRGDMLPPFKLMESAQRFVDVRFARICYERGIAMVCLAREQGWLRDMEPAESIFESYTKVSHRDQIDEVSAFGGFGKLTPSTAFDVESL